jgi:hypothetical protein
VEEKANRKVQKHSDCYSTFLPHKTKHQNISPDSPAPHPTGKNGGVKQDTRVIPIREILDFWANQTPLFRGKLLRHPNSPDLSDSLIPFSGSGKMVLIKPKKKKSANHLH